MLTNPISYYNWMGLPATATITINRAPNTLPISSATLQFVIGAYTLNWGYPGTSATPDFWGGSSYEIAKSLAAAINANISRSDLTPNTVPIKTIYALYYGNVVVIVSTVPGLIGNTIGLTASSSDSGCYTLSGATLSGGTDSFPTLARGQFLVAAPGGSNGVAQVSATTIPFQQAWFYGLKTVSSTVAPTANAATVWIGEGATALLTKFTDPVATSGVPTLVQAPQNKKFDLVNFWLLAPTSADTVYVKYI